MKRLLLSLLAILVLTLAVGTPAFADSIIFFLNTDETPGQPPANTIEVEVTLTNSTTAVVDFSNQDPSDTSYDLHNVFLNVNGNSEIGSCTPSNNCSSITGTGTGNGPYYYVASQSGGFGTMTYNVDDTGTAATSVTVNLTATGSTTWTSASNVLTPDSSGYEASVELLTQSGYQAAGSYTPEPSGTLLLGAGLLALGLPATFKKAIRKPPGGTT
jgi:hypothetical protein